MTGRGRPAGVTTTPVDSSHSRLIVSAPARIVTSGSGRCAAGRGRGADGHLDEGGGASCAVAAGQGRLGGAVGVAEFSFDAAQGFAEASLRRRGRAARGRGRSRRGWGRAVSETLSSSSRPTRSQPSGSTRWHQYWTTCLTSVKRIVRHCWSRNCSSPANAWRRTSLAMALASRSTWPTEMSPRASASARGGHRAQGSGAAHDRLRVARRQVRFPRETRPRRTRPVRSPDAVLVPGGREAGGRGVQAALATGETVTSSVNAASSSSSGSAATRSSRTLSSRSSRSVPMPAP